MTVSKPKVNIAPHDLLWRRVSFTTKKTYRESFGAASQTPRNFQRVDPNLPH